jgi:hypothetical protein
VSSAAKIRIPIAVLAAAAGLCALGAAVPASAALTPQAKVATSVPGLSVLESIACPTAKACVGVGMSTSSLDGRSVAVNAATGSVKVWPGGLANVVPNSVACPDTATCVAVADDAVASVKVSDAAMKVTGTIPLPSSGIVAMGAIACAGTKTCYAVGFEGTEAASSALLVKISSSGKILAKVTGTGTGDSAIACPSSTTCLVTEHTKTAELVVPLNNGRLGAGHKLAAETYVESIRCYAASLCYALGGSPKSNNDRTDELITLNPKTGQPGKIVSLGGVNGDAFACYSATQCVVVGYTGTGDKAVAATVVVTKGKLGAVKHYASISPFDSVACATAKLCYAGTPGATSAGAALVRV